MRLGRIVKMTNKRKCNCGFEGEEREFGVLRLTSCSSPDFTAAKPKNERGINVGVGASFVYICPKCGSIYCFKDLL